MSASEARRTALAAQGFAASRPKGRIDRRHLRRAMSHLGVLQLDSIPVVMRTQYLVLYARVGPFRATLLDQIAYGDDEWFEAWCHEACLVPVALEPQLRWLRERAAAGGTWVGLVELAHRERDYIDAVLAEVAERGPLRAGDLSDPRPRQGEWWGSRSVGQLALDWLFRIGAVGIRRGPNFDKHFDLFDRVVPAHVRDLPSPTPADAMRTLLGEAAAALGVATADDLIDYHRLPKREARPLVDDLLEAGTIIPTAVEGWGAPAYRDAAARTPRRIDARALLSPFDPVVWYRPRALRVFGFDYRIEVYVPAAKRRYGYYVLPVLLGDRLVARLDLKTHRAEGVLEVRGAFAEPDVDVAGIAADVVTELGTLASFVGAERLRILPNGDLAPALDRAHTLRCG